MHCIRIQTADKLGLPQAKEFYMHNTGVFAHPQ